MIFWGFIFTSYIVFFISTPALKFSIDVVFTLSMGILTCPPNILSYLNRALDEIKQHKYDNGVVIVISDHICGDLILTAVVHLGRSPGGKITILDLTH